MKRSCFFVGLLLIFALFLSACNTNDKPDNIGDSLDNLKNYSPALNPHLLKDTKTDSYANFISLLEDNPNEVRDGDIIIATINDWPIALSEIISFAIQEEIMMEHNPFYEDIYRSLLEGTLMLAMAEEKNALPTQEELAAFGAKQKEEMNDIDPGELDILESTMDKMGISIDDYLTYFQPYHDYRTLAGQGLLPIFQEEMAKANGNESGEEYWNEYAWNEYMADYMSKAEIKYITKIPELQFTY